MRGLKSYASLLSAAQAFWFVPTGQAWRVDYTRLEPVDLDQQLCDTSHLWSSEEATRMPSRLLPFLIWLANVD